MDDLPSIDITEREAQGNSKLEHHIFQNKLGDLVGNTPVVSMPDLWGLGHGPLAKLEKFNPGGSVKDRVAAYVFEKVISIQPETWTGPIVESSSGNLGIALAMLGAARGIEVIIVVDPNTSAQNIAIMRAYGAVIEVERELDSKGLYHETKLARARRIAYERDGYWVNQTANFLNAEAHRETTGREIVREFDTSLDVLAIATSSGGQLRGIAEAVKAHSPQTRIMAVDAVGSQIFSRRTRAYVTPGLGLSWTPVLIDRRLVDYVCLVEDALAFGTARMLARRGLLVGPSSGAVAAACYRIQAEGRPLKVLGICSDGGERYLSSLFDDAWMISKGFCPLERAEDIAPQIAALELNVPDA